MADVAKTIEEARTYIIEKAQESLHKQAVFQNIRKIMKKNGIDIYRLYELAKADKENRIVIFDNELKSFPVMRGHWIYSEEYGDLVTNKCSLCGQTMTTYEGKLMNYCPNCGAKMNLED